MIAHLLSYAFYIGPSACLPVLPKTFCQRLKMPKVQNAKTPIPQRVILPNLFHQQLNLPEQNTNHSNKDITWSTPGHDWQNGWERIYVVSTCRDWRFYQSCSFLIWWLICFFHVILFYQCDWLPFWVWVWRTRLGEVSCLFPNQEDSAAPLSYACYAEWFYAETI